MKPLKDLKIVLLFVSVVLVLVIVRTTGKNRFKQDAQSAVESVQSNNFWVSEKELKETESQFLIIDLNDSEIPSRLKFENTLKIQFQNLLEESSFQKLEEAENKILLYSDDNSRAIKAWIILNQLGLENLFVLSNEENPEVLKYEFQPDTLAKLESVSE